MKACSLWPSGDTEVKSALKNEPEQEAKQKPVVSIFKADERSRPSDRFGC